MNWWGSEMKMQRIKQRWKPIVVTLKGWVKIRRKGRLTYTKRQSCFLQQCKGISDRYDLSIQLIRSQHEHKLTAPLVSNGCVFRFFLLLFLMFHHVCVWMLGCGDVHVKVRGQAQGSFLRSYLLCLEGVVRDRISNWPAWTVNTSTWVPPCPWFYF